MKLLNRAAFFLFRIVCTVVFFGVAVAPIVFLVGPAYNTASIDVAFVASVAMPCCIAIGALGIAFVWSEQP